jgi:hypothetical protein
MINSGILFVAILALFIFFRVEENEPTTPRRDRLQTPVSRGPCGVALRVVQPVDEAVPHAAMRRCQACSGAHNLTIAVRLATPDALPAITMLAASTGCVGRSTRKLASLKQSARFYPAASPMLGPGQWEANATPLCWGAITIVQS